MSENTNTNKNTTQEITLEMVMQELQSIKSLQKEGLGALGCVLTNQMAYLQDKRDGAKDDADKRMYTTGLAATQSCIDSLLKSADIMPHTDIKVMHVKAENLDDVLKAIFG